MDIDIDTPTAFNPSLIFAKWVKASMIREDELIAHNCGVHPQEIPIDPVTGFSAIPYKDAEKLGYYKIDFLHLGVYDYFESREEIEALLKIEPDWGLMLVPSEQRKLFQLSKHGDIINAVKPKSVEQLADVLALIRPGKKQLLKLYLAQPNAARKVLYAKDEDGYSFKKSQAIAYAMVIVLQLHLISAGVI